MAIGDIDSDGYADLVTINDAENKFQVHYYDSHARKYNMKTPPTVVDPGNEQAKIVSIVIAKNMHLLQNLYVVYREATVGSTFIKVFETSGDHNEPKPFVEKANAFETVLSIPNKF